MKSRISAVLATSVALFFGSVSLADSQTVSVDDLSLVDEARADRPNDDVLNHYGRYGRWGGHHGRWGGHDGRWGGHGGRWGGHHGRWGGHGGRWGGHGGRWGGHGGRWGGHGGRWG